MSPISTNRIKSASDALPAEINDLIKCIRELPEAQRQKLEGCADRIVEFTQRRRRILNLVQDALGQLRLDMKYLMFDLDATRRERDECRKELDEHNLDD